MQGLTLGPSFDALHFGIQMELNAVALECLRQQLRGFTFLLRQELRVAVDDAHLAAQTAKRLRQFAAQWPAADHEQPPWPLRKVEDGFVGEKAGLGQPLDVRRHGTRAGGDHCLRKAQGDAADLDRIVRRKSRIAKPDIDAEFLEARSRIVLADARAQTTQALHGPLKIGFDPGRYPYPKLLRAAHVGEHARRADQYFGRHAANIEAVTAHQVALDQRDLAPEASDRCGTG